MSVIKNHLLFNHTYLQQLQDDGRIDEEAAAVAQGVRDWYAFCDASSIQTLIDSWVSPMLSILELEIQPLQAPHAHLLYSSWEQQNPVGLCYVTPAGAGLDTTSKGQHWLAQAVLAARRWQNDGQNNSPLRWVILTNGDLWRLLDAHSLRRYEAYLQVDLGQIARGAGDITALRIFYHCFHRHAFVTPILEKPNGLEQLLTASERATGQAEKHLKARVSHNEGIMAQLCLGFVRATGKSSFTEAERDAIYRDATILLYRILFIFYAEARELLPMHNPAYEAVSLSSLVQQAISYQQRGMDNPQATSLWAKLKRLFNAIYASDETLQIPAYNGGLFNDAERPYLGDSTIADAYLSRALYDLACLPGNGNDYQLIDYRDLSVRHLGSLYEGMIEYKLFVAEEPMLARRDSKGNIHYLSQAETGGLRRHDEEIKQGDVYFAQSSGERRATGTYYTPEYIVHYIVEQTVGQGLAERRATLEAKLDNWLAEIAAADPAERPRMRVHVDQELLRFVQEQILTFRVCDPGMGSGHFLVNAAHQITNFIVETLHLTPWPNDTIDADPVQWRRCVVESCLYGVDINQMAVELAKLSLWLVTMTPSKTLSFLKHHLRQGNSLIGARLEDLAELMEAQKPKRRSRREEKARAAGQLSLLDQLGFEEHITVASDLMAQISARITETLADVKTQESDYAQVRTELAPFHQLAHLVTARYFGLEVDKKSLLELTKYLVNGSAATVPSYHDLFREAREKKEKYSFLHWELEYPDVFYRGSSSIMGMDGFDAIVGNPPYLSVEQVPTDVKDFWNETSMIAHKRFDVYGLFLHTSTSNLLNHSGLVGLIIPTTFFDNQSYLKLRLFLNQETHIHTLWNLGDGIFPGARNDVCIMILGKQEELDEASPTKIRDTSYGRNLSFTIDHQSLFRGEENRISTKITPEQSLIQDKLERQSVHLRVLTNGTQGFVTGLNEAYVLGLDELSNIPFAERDIVRPVSFGQHIGRYTQYEPKEYLLYLTEKTDLEKYPYMKQLIVPYKNRLSQRREVRRGLIPWYSLQWPREEWYFQSKEAIYVQIIRNLRLKRRIIATFNIHEAYADHTLNVLHTTPETKYAPAFILALLNSNLFNWLFLQLYTDINIKLSYLRELPIHRVEFSTENEERESLVIQGQQLYDRFLSEADPTNISNFVIKQLHQTPERSDIVHDLLAFLAQQMSDLNLKYQAIEKKSNLFQIVNSTTSCFKLTKAMPELSELGEALSHLSLEYHDIEGMRLIQEENKQWLLEIQIKLRDPETSWREFQKDVEGNLIRQWLPVCHLALDEEVGQFYHYAFANLDGFTGAGKFPGGHTRTTYEKLMATEVPRYVPVDLTPLVEAEAELAEIRRKIELTDKLIDQIVYKLYGLTDDEIAIVEVRV